MRKRDLCIILAYISGVLQMFSWLFTRLGLYVYEFNFVKSMRISNILTVIAVILLLISFIIFIFKKED